MTIPSSSRFARALKTVGSLVCATASIAALTTAPAATPATAAPAAVGTDTGTTFTGERLRLVAAPQAVFLKRQRGVVATTARRTLVVNGTRFRGAGTVELPPRVNARSWVVADLDTGRILGKHNARRHLPQASTIKLLSALTAVETVPVRPRHRVTAFEKNQTCTCVGLVRGQRYSRSALLAGMLLPSGNDAAEALAGSHPQGRWAFYAAMNVKAAELGATDTVAGNASGLTASGSHSSARDLVVLLRAALAEPKVAPYLSLRSATISSLRGKGVRTLDHGTDYVESYPGTAGKSGYTTPALNTLVVTTPIGGRNIAVATMGAPGGYSTSGTRALTEWAARNFDELRAVGKLPEAP